jgi:hypothetical protein
MTENTQEKATDRMLLLSLIDTFKGLEYEGAEEDKPEGSKWVRISASAMEVIIELLGRIYANTESD